MKNPKHEAGTNGHKPTPYLEARHVQIQEEARALALRHLEALDVEAEHHLAAAARTSLRRMAEAGLFRHAVPKRFGGAAPEVEVRALVAAREGVAYGSGLADALLALQGLGSMPLTLAGSTPQRTQWLPKVAQGAAVPAFAITEPEAGSDLAAMTTRARRIPGGFEITGTKTLISNAGLADFYCVFAKTQARSGGRGITCFLVPADAKGLTVEPLRVLAPHPIGTVHFRKVRVRDDDVIGEEGSGLKIALGTLDRMRPTVAAAAVGFAQRALDAAVARARSRRQFRRPIGANQGLRWRLAEAATEIEAARLLVHKAAHLKDSGAERITLASAQAKLFATEAAQRAADLCLQVHGGSGTLAGSLPERLYREVRALRIYEGTSEILRDLIARSLLD